MSVGEAEWTILLINLGGPRSRDEIEPFLFDLFMDRAIIPIPLEGRMRYPFARFLARRRARTVQERYGFIGGASPLVQHTLDQAAALGRQLSSRGRPWSVRVAMRYGRPSLEEIIGSLPARTRHLAVLPLFPQYCRATTGSVETAVQKALATHRSDMDYHVAAPFWDNDKYLQAMARRIIEAGHRTTPFPAADTAVLFAAHGVPESFVRKGDPYVSQIEGSVERIARLCELPENTWRLAWQSQVGPVRWVGPTTERVVSDLATQGITRLSVVPISFVSDHLETLYDIDIVLQRHAIAAGIKEFRRIPCFNDAEDFADILADLAENLITKVDRDSPR